MTADNNNSMNQLLGTFAQQADDYIKEFQKMIQEAETENVECLFVKMDEIKMLEPLPKDSTSKALKNYKHARELYNEAYRLVAKTIGSFISSNFSVGKHDKKDSFGYKKSAIPAQAASRIALLHHAPDKIDIIVAALNHDDPEVQLVGVQEYMKLDASVKNNTTYFPHPDTVKTRVRQLRKELNYDE
jgi:hypothetical protein